MLLWSQGCQSTRQTRMISKGQTSLTYILHFILLVCQSWNAAKISNPSYIIFVLFDSCSILPNLQVLVFLFLLHWLKFLLKQFLIGFQFRQIQLEWNSFCQKAISTIYSMQLITIEFYIHSPNFGFNCCIFGFNIQKWILI